MSSHIPGASSVRGRMFRIANIRTQQRMENGRSATVPIIDHANRCPWCANSGLVINTIGNRDFGLPCPMCHIGALKDAATADEGGRTFWDREPRPELVTFANGVTILHRLCRPCMSRAESDVPVWVAPGEDCSACSGRNRIGSGEQVSRAANAVARNLAT